MPATEPLTRKRLKELLDYNPETGVFTWKKRKEGPTKWNTRFAGKEAGTAYRSSSGKTEYIMIKIAGVDYRAHRLAFLYMEGYWPDQIDHANGIGTDNRWGNLSNGTPSDNHRNRALSSGSSTGISGVSWAPENGKYRVRIKKDGKRYSGGYFSDKEEAAKKAKELYNMFGFHQNHGLPRQERAAKSDQAPALGRAAHNSPSIAV